jgi:hypothetical protein
MAVYVGSICNWSDLLLGDELACFGVPLDFLRKDFEIKEWVKAILGNLLGTCDNCSRKTEPDRVVEVYISSSSIPRVFFLKQVMFSVTSKPGERRWRRSTNRPPG